MRPARRRDHGQRNAIEEFLDGVRPPGFGLGNDEVAKAEDDEGGESNDGGSTPQQEQALGLSAAHNLPARQTAAVPIAGGETIQGIHRG
jgi:hypothetical protein